MTRTFGTLSTTTSTVSQLYGYRMVAAWLADLGVWTTRGSVERLIKGLPLYTRPNTE